MYRFLLILFVFVSGINSSFAQNRPQTPKPPFPYLEREISFKNAQDGTVIGGTLSLPNQKGRAAAVILLPGSGAVDRDQTMLGHKPFAVIADYLTRRNIAVLRLDSRSVGKSAGNYYNSTGNEFAGDALSGIEFLKAQKEIDGGKIGLIGHSLGGMVAALAAAKSSDVKFVVFLASPALPDNEISGARMTKMLRARNLPDAELQKYLAVINDFQNLQKQNAGDDQMRPIVRELTKALYPVQLPDKDLDALVEQQLSVQKTPFAKFFAVFDPRESLKKLNCPVLALNGSLDQIISAKENLSAIYETLSQNKNATVIEIYGVNHLFQTAKTGAPTEYAEIEETVSPKVLAIISGWIETHSSAQSGAK